MASRQPPAIAKLRDFLDTKDRRDAKIRFDIGTDVAASYSWCERNDGGDEGDIVRFEFRGTPDALTDAGVATPGLLAKLPRGSKARVDADGDRAYICRGARRWRLELFKPIDRALRMPGYSVAPLLERFRRPPAKA